jgi:hypothetical protein
MQLVILFNLVCWSLTWVKSNSQVRQNNNLPPECGQPIDGGEKALLYQWWGKKDHCHRLIYILCCQKGRVRPRCELRQRKWRFKYQIKYYYLGFSPRKLHLGFVCQEACLLSECPGMNGRGHCLSNGRKHCLSHMVHIFYSLSVDNGLPKICVDLHLKSGRNGNSDVACFHRLLERQWNTKIW